MSFSSLDFYGYPASEWEDKRAMSKKIAEDVRRFVEEHGGRIEQCPNSLDDHNDYARKVFIHKEGTA